MRKYRSIMIGVILGLGVVLLTNFLGSRYNLSNGKIMVILIVIGILMILGALAYNYSVIKKYNKRVAHQVELLNNHKASEALKDMEEMVVELDNKGLDRISRFIKLNMSACYCDLKEYNKSLDVLLSMKDVKFSRDELLIYELNLCVSYFYLGRLEEALKEYDDNKDFFNEFSEDKNYGANIAAVNVMALIAKKDYKEARATLERSKDKWNNERLKADYQAMDHFLSQFENRY